MIPVDKIEKAGYSKECVDFYRAFEALRPTATSNGNIVAFKKLLIMSLDIFKPSFSLSRRGIANQVDINTLSALLNSSLTLTQNTTPTIGPRPAAQAVVSGAIQGSGNNTFNTPDCPTCPNGDTAAAHKIIGSGDDFKNSKGKLAPIGKGSKSADESTETNPVANIVKGAFIPDASVLAAHSVVDGIDEAAIRQIMNENSPEYPSSAAREKEEDTPLANEMPIETSPSVTEEIEHEHKVITDLDDCKTWLDVKNLFSRGGEVHNSTAAKTMRDILISSKIPIDEEQKRQIDYLAKAIYDNIIAD